MTRFSSLAGLAGAALVGLVLLCVGAASTSGHAAPAAPKAWEYSTVRLSGEPGNELNDAGRLGWELVSVTPTRESQFLYVFKRPKSR